MHLNLFFSIKTVIFSGKGEGSDTEATWQMLASSFQAIHVLLDPQQHQESLTFLRVVQ